MILLKVAKDVWSCAQNKKTESVLTNTVTNQDIEMVFETTGMLPSERSIILY